MAKEFDVQDMREALKVVSGIKISVNGDLDLPVSTGAQVFNVSALGGRAEMDRVKSQIAAYIIPACADKIAMAALNPAGDGFVHSQYEFGRGDKAPPVLSVSMGLDDDATPLQAAKAALAVSAVFQDAPTAFYKDGLIYTANADKRAGGKGDTVETLTKIVEAKAGAKSLGSDPTGTLQ